MSSRVDSKYPPYYLYERGKLLEINERWIERDYSVAYPVRPEIWRRFCRDGVHSAFDAKVMCVSWKPSAVPVVVVRIPQEANETGSDQFVWCVRASITTDLPFVIGGRIGDKFLWPLSPADAQDFCKTLSDGTIASVGGSRLITDLRPWIHPTEPTRRLFESWVQIPGTFELDTASKLRTDHIMIAAVRPSADDPLLSQPEQVAKFMTLPSDQLHVCSTGGAGRSYNGRLCRPFDVLSGDTVDCVLWPLVTAYINTPAYGAHRNWTSLRTVSSAFRDGVDRVTAAWVARATKLARGVLESRQVAPALELRDFVVPTGIDVLQLLAEVYSAHHPESPRQQVLIYMRLRAQKTIGANPPPPKPPLSVQAQRAVDFGPRMCITHGELLKHDYTSVRAYNTRRANEAVSLCVRMVGRVPDHLVNYAKICCGWEMAGDPKSPGLGRLEDSC